MRVGRVMRRAWTVGAVLTVSVGALWSVDAEREAGASQRDPLIFTYSGVAESVSVPANVCAASVDVKGAGGGAGLPFSFAVGPMDASGGGGGRVQALLAVAAGETLWVSVGGGGGGPPIIGNGGGGGGASDVRQGGSSVGDRVVVAGGGGGGEGYADLHVTPGRGGNGDGSPGTDGLPTGNNLGGVGPGGGGGTLTEGGLGGAPRVPAFLGHVVAGDGSLAMGGHGGGQVFSIPPLPPELGSPGEYAGGAGGFNGGTEA